MIPKLMRVLLERPNERLRADIEAAANVLKNTITCVKTLLFASILASTSFAQEFHIGIKAGMRTIDDLKSSGQVVSESRRYTVGPMVEFGLWHRLSMEVDMLYKRLGTSRFDNSISVNPAWSRERSDSLEFPILAKYRLASTQFAPYISGGLALRFIHGSGSTTYVSAGQIEEFSYTLHYQNSEGLVLGGGVEFRLLRTKISPEFRYTRWFNAAYSNDVSRGFFLQSAHDQAEILVGLAWP
jgi:hypothetical protein